MGIKLVALDIDGTILNSQVQMADETRRAMCKAIEMGVYIVPCTGRVLSQLPSEIVELPGMDYIISAAGARVSSQLHSQKVVYENSLSKKMIEAIQKEIGSSRLLIEAYSQGNSYIERDVYENYSDF